MVVFFTFGNGSPLSCQTALIPAAANVFGWSFHILAVPDWLYFSVYLTLTDLQIR